MLAVLWLCHSPSPSGFPSFLTSSWLLICIPFSMPSTSCLPPWGALPIPNTRLIQHSVYSTFLPKLPDTAAENHTIDCTIVLIGAVTNWWVSGSAGSPTYSLLALIQKHFSNILPQFPYLNLSWCPYFICNNNNKESIELNCLDFLDFQTKPNWLFAPLPLSPIKSSPYFCPALREN